MQSKWKRWVIFVALVLVLAGGFGVYARTRNSEGAASASSESSAGAENGRVPVVLSPVAMHDFEERLTVQGNLEAKDYAMVPARIGGVIQAMYVKEGDIAVAGETKLFQVDALKPQKAVEANRQALAVGRCATREKEANLERVEADFEKAELDLKRFEDLHAAKAVSQDALEQQQSRYKQARAGRKHAVSLVELAKEQERQAEAALAIAEKDLSDTLVRAPISGRVSLQLQEVGEMAETGKPVFRIDDPAVLEMSAFLPAEYYARTSVGKTIARVRVAGTDPQEYTISYKSPTIDPRLRTFEVKCLLEHPPEGVVPGAIAEVAVLLERRAAWGVPTEAIQGRGGSSVVFTVDNETARLMEVEPGLETDGWTEVQGESIAGGIGVVTMGQHLLDDGSRVTVRKGAA